MGIKSKVKKTIRTIYDFPKEGIIFRDIMPLLGDPVLTDEITTALYESVRSLKIDAVMGIESRGFFWGILLAQKLQVPFIPVRKKGKLPYKTLSHQYELEYGIAEIEVHDDMLKSGSKVLIHDDLLATGGTASAAAQIAQKKDVEIIGFSFLVTLEFLKGKEKLNQYSDNIFEIIKY